MERESDFVALKSLVAFLLSTINEQSPGWFDGITWKQVKLVQSLMQEGLIDQEYLELDDNAYREHRLKVMSVLLDRRINSTNFLSKWEAKVLIDALKAEGELHLSEDGLTLIQGAEAAVILASGNNEEEAAEKSDDSRGSCLPDLPQGNWGIVRHARGFPLPGRLTIQSQSV